MRTNDDGVSCFVVQKPNYVFSFAFFPGAVHAALVAKGLPVCFAITQCFQFDFLELTFNINCRLFFSCRTSAPAFIGIAG